MFGSITSILSSDLVNGPVAVGIRQTLPFKGVHLLLGNDLAGDKVVVNPLVTGTLCMDQSLDPIEQELPDLYPSCAVTRAMAKKAMLTENQSDVDLTDSFIGQSFKNEITKFLSHISHNLFVHQKTQMTVHQYPIFFLHLKLKKTMI